jgi:acyl carrier protein
MQCHVVDEQLRPTGVGQEGELLIGGAGIARGYLNRHELTAEKFIADPFGDNPQARLYRTGDLVRWSPEGNIEFLGRIDQQVKISGFRIETGEIESVLTRHEMVQECALAAWDGPLGGKRLVAYLVPRTGARPALEELRRYLGETLPDYMVPSAFLFLSALPLLPNGKVNRKLLPAPDGKRPDLLQTFVPPAPGLETDLAAIWREALFLDQVGVDDSFFELGGSSLQMAHVHFRLQKALDREFKITDLFNHPTVRQQAAHFNPARPAGSGTQRIDDRASRQRASMAALRNIRR